LDGNGYTIKNLNATLFGITNGLRVYDLNIVNSAATDGGIVAEAANGGRFENITVTGSVRFYSNGGGIAGSVNGDAFINRCSFAGELLTRATVSGSNNAGGLVGSFNGGFLLNSGAMGIAGANSMPATSSGISQAAAAGGVVGSANNIIAVNNYSNVDVYSTGGSASNAGGLFGSISNSIVRYGYATGDVYAAVRYHTSAAKLMPSAGGISGYAAGSDIKYAAYLGGRLTTEYYDILGAGGAEGYAAGAFARSGNLTFSDIYSNSAVDILSDDTSGIYGSLINISGLTDSFYREALGLDFDILWRSLNPADIRIEIGDYPVFSWARDVLYPPADGDEWYWYAVRGYYEEF
jgi:hypothetical protein